MYFYSGMALAADRVRPVDWAQTERRFLMKSRKKIVAGMVAMALGSGAYAATFEGRLACDQDPREAATSCMLFVPVTDTVGLPVYTQQISVTSLLEPRGEAAAGMESEAQAASEISASAPVTESFSSEPAPQIRASLSEDSSVYPRNEVAEGRPVFDEPDRQASASSSRSGLLSWFRSDRGSSISNDSRARDLASTSLMEETEPFPEEKQVLASAPSRFGLFSWLTGDRGSRSESEQSAAIDSQQSSHELVVTESSSDTIGQPRDLASNSLMEESEPPSSENERVSSSGSRRIFSWLTGDHGARSMSEPSAAAEPSSEHLADAESSETPDRS
jgi:hypothetical protein